MQLPHFLSSTKETLIKKENKFSSAQKNPTRSLIIEKEPNVEVYNEL